MPHHLPYPAHLPNLGENHPTYAFSVTTCVRMLKVVIDNVAKMYIYSFNSENELDGMTFLELLN